MTEMVMNTKTLPDFLFGIIQTEKVSVREVGGEIRLNPITEVPKKPRSELRGILKNKVWMSDDFNAPIEEMKEYI